MSTSKPTNNAIVFVCMNDRDLNAELLELAITSLRIRSKFKDDIIVFTDFERPLRNESDMCITRVIVEPGVTKDPKNFRIYMNRFYDFSVHKKIIYLDFDILALKNVNRAFSFIRGDDVYFTYAPVFGWADSAFMAGALADEFRDSPVVSGSPTGICSGIFGIRTQVLDSFLDLWKDVLKTTPTDNDQHALNELIIRDSVRGLPFPNEWVSYPYQVRQESDDRRIFSKPRDFMFYHFNPVNNQVKFTMMKEYLEQG